MTTETPYHNNHTRFGGMIYESDFFTNNHPSNRVSDRIIADMKFDERCRRNIEMRKEWSK